MELVPQPFEVTKENGKVNIVLDMSSYDLFELCKARYNYRHNLLKVPQERKSKALDMGSLVHEGYEVYYKELQKGTHFNDRMQACYNRIYSYATTEDPNVEEQDLKLVIGTVEQNLDYWRVDDEVLEILEVERAFAYVLYEDAEVRIVLTGKIDLFCNIPKIGRSAGYTGIPLDHKTYQREFEVPRLSNQFMNYTFATQSNYLMVNRIGFQKTLKPEEKFKRPVVSYDPIMLEEWKQDVIQTVLHEYLDCVGRNFWKRNFTSCFKFNRKCEYYDICESSGAEAKAFKLETNYRLAEQWDVTKKLEE